MKKIISLLAAVAMVLSLATGVMAERLPENAKNNICIMGKVEFKDTDTITVSIENVDGQTIYSSKFNCVNPDGSYTISFKYTGDMTQRMVKLTYNGEDVTGTIKSLTSVTDLLKADVKDGAIKAEDKFYFDDGATALVVSYDGSGKLIGAKSVEGKKADTAIAFENPEGAVTSKAFCWNAIADVREYSKLFENLQPKVDIFCIGDSYGQTYPSNFYPESGWGGHLQDYFNDRVTVANFCTSGGWAQAIMSNTQDAKYQQNIADGKKGTDGMYGWDDWNDMEKSLSFSKGDYIIVSLGLNDTSKNGPDGMAPIEWYGMALEEMAKRAEAKGVNLILCSPLQRASVKVDTTSEQFADKTEEIAEKYNLIYLNALDALQKQYAKECKSDDEVLRKYYLHRDELLKPVAEGGWGLTAEQIENHGQAAMQPGGSGKNAHPNIKGADNMARTMVELLKETDCLLKDYMK